MRQYLVYDLPTRIFHWLFALLFVFAFAVAKVIDDDSPIYSFHMLTGITMVFLVVLRIAWGIFGSKHSRFTHFALNPVALLNYFKGFLTNDKTKWAGHNPASSWAAVTMLFLTLGLGATGYLMTAGGNKEFYEDIHEIFANVFILVVLMHIAGIVLHSIRHQELIGLSMLDGKKQNIRKEDEISSSRPMIALFFIMIFGVFSVQLIKNYNSSNRQLNFLGTQLNLGETEDNEKKESHENKNNESHDKDSDDD